MPKIFYINIGHENQEVYRVLTIVQEIRMKFNMY